VGTSGWCVSRTLRFVEESLRPLSVAPFQGDFGRIDSDDLEFSARVADRERCDYAVDPKQYLLPVDVGEADQCHAVVFTSIDSGVDGLLGGGKKDVFTIGIRSLVLGLCFFGLLVDGVLSLRVRSARGRGVDRVFGRGGYRSLDGRW